MRILVVSMNSIHFKRWVSQLENSGHEVFWFDVYDGGYSKEISWVKQGNGWRSKFNNFRGRTTLKNLFPRLYKYIFERKIAESFENYLELVKPDCVHSFALYVSCVPIEYVMLKHPKIKWVYSSWGSDLFYFRNIKSYLEDIKRILPQIDYLFTDCFRDFSIAKELNFKNTHLGVYPGGGGFDLKGQKQYIQPVLTRNTILLKGYENRSGRANNVLKAFINLESELLRKEIKVVIFGATKELISFYNDEKQNINFEVEIFELEKQLSHINILKLMGEALIYIGNSNSDGMPNTLLEAICMGAFPIQSNPGSVTEEVVINKKNGLLIDNCEDINEIENTIKTAINNKNMLENAFIYNQKLKEKYDFESIKKEVLNKYKLIENEL